MRERVIVLPDKHFYEELVEISKELYLRALKIIPPDVRAALVKAYESEESERGKNILGVILKNIEVAEQNDLIICQDTGTPIFLVNLPQEIDLNLTSFKDSLVAGVRKATTEHPFRSSIVSPLTRKNNQDSTGYRIPVFHFEYKNDADDKSIDILMIPKGSGSENMSYLKMLTPAEGIKGIKKFVLQSIMETGANPCPPYIVGIGLGGTSDLCMINAKKAAVREVGSHNGNQEIAELETELFTMINSLGFGPMGLGGKNTCLAVHIEEAYTHISQNPVGINIQCWAARRSRAKIDPHGNVEYGF
ncbi:Fe-S hydro-lyase, tartrate dehydratase alpha-type, catalytic domain [Moorella glycerini]|uniref:L(+)-tartrate dehydratase subunit alpha n=1 Tax=Neomoorella stamsii TaxID=1266720 RepID=A0A9X7J5I4_9FIRM|nr:MULTISPECIES: fumarate hydratase [Moorella]PRR76427.1 L(+)-tartrate dehydratase subunit alpha [Moorella stamsii]CEP67004.1 Fe-S hydro-lyase, tartrate dehydratase alpha-type, catalytic domain [Moorella glycerini]